MLANPTIISHMHMVIVFYCVCGDRKLYIPEMKRYNSPTHLPSYPPTHLPTYPPTRVPAYPHTHLPAYPPTRLPTYPPTHLPTYPPTHLPSCPPTHLPTYPPTHLYTHLPTYPLTHLPTYPHTHLPTYSLYRQGGGLRTAPRRGGTNWVIFFCPGRGCMHNNIETYTWYRRAWEVI